MGRPIHKCMACASTNIYMEWRISSDIDEDGEFESPTPFPFWTCAQCGQDHFLTASHGMLKMEDFILKMRSEEYDEDDEDDDEDDDSPDDVFDLLAMAQQAIPVTLSNKKTIDSVQLVLDKYEVLIEGAYKQIIKVRGLLEGVSPDARTEEYYDLMSELSAAVEHWKEMQEEEAVNLSVPELQVVPSPSEPATEAVQRPGEPAQDVSEPLIYKTDGSTVLPKIHMKPDVEVTE
jgi:hypothetical protein